MQIESFNVRENSLPITEITSIKVKKFDVKESVDEDGVAHSVLKEKVDDDFLDVPFRDFSMTTYVATGEVTRLKYISPVGENSLDVYDRLTGDLEEVSAKINHMEIMNQVAASAEKTEPVSE